MHKFFLLVLLTGIAQLHAFAGNTDDFSFKHHTFEVSATPAVDYHFVTNAKHSPNYRQSANNLYRPFAGGNLGLSYTYRPIKFVGVSTGFNFTEFVSKLGSLSGYGINYYGYVVTTTIPIKGYVQTGYISVPIQIHAFYPIRKITLELATGPEFIFPAFDAAKYTVTYTNFPIAPSTYDKTNLNSADKMKQYSQFGWDIQLNANIPVKENFYLAVGPEMKFLNIRPFNPASTYTTEPRMEQYYAGVKFSFRFPVNFTRNSKSASPTK